MTSELNKIGKYEILSILGQGAMGTIYKGIDPVIQRLVAIKTISTHIPSAEQQALKERFIREAQAAGRLQHINIVGIYEYGEDADQAYIAMEFVEGLTLADKLHANIQLTISDICHIMSKLLDALSYAHSMGVVHRDIKPGNIILTDTGEIKVMDFGIARLESSTMTQIGTLLGTPAYMSPEQLVGENVDNRSDIFSAGVLLYELLTGEKAYSGTTFTSVMYKILNTDPVPPASLCPVVPKVFDEIVSKALEKKPENRFQTAKEFSDAIVRAAGNLSSGTSGTHDTGQLTPPPLDEKSFTGRRKPQLQVTPGDEREKQPPSKPFQNDADATRIISPPKSRGRRNMAYVVGGVLLLGIAVIAGWPLLKNTIRQQESSVTAPAAMQIDEGVGARQDLPPSRGADYSDAVASDTTTGRAETVPKSPVTDRYKSGQRLKDCDSCPELVVIPPGSFIKGSPVSETERLPSEGPQHINRIGYPLAVGRYEVTLDEFQQFIKDTGYRASGCNIYQSEWLNDKDNSWKNPGYEQTGRHPATCIAWNDAQTYAKWLSGKTNHSYRLLSSAEWEYIARAGTQTSRYWGDDAGQACLFANVADSSAEKRYKGWDVHNCNDDFIYTAPVGSFKPNSFSVYDMLGNAFEWVEDCWNEDYDGAPTNGASWTRGDCNQRILRGGSWFSMPRFVRPAFRNRFSPDYRSSTFGFRVARVLE